MIGRIAIAITAILLGGCAGLADERMVQLAALMGAEALPITGPTATATRTAIATIWATTERMTAATRVVRPSEIIPAYQSVMGSG